MSAGRFKFFRKWHLVAHTTHSLVGGRGIVWCWRCGVYAVQPKLLCRPCRGGATQFGKVTLARLRRGLPPYGLRNRWPDGEDTLFLRLVVGQ